MGGKSERSFRSLLQQQLRKREKLRHLLLRNALDGSGPLRELSGESLLVPPRRTLGRLTHLASHRKRPSPATSKQFHSSTAVHNHIRDAGYVAAQKDASGDHSRVLRQSGGRVQLATKGLQHCYCREQGCEFVQL